MKYIILSALAVVVLALLPGSCISEFQAELPVKEDDILVVTGDIVENTEVKFVLSKSFSINFAKPSPENQNVAATITVVEKYLWLKKTGPGGDWNYDEVDKEASFDLFTYTYRKCADCIFAGGTKSKPDFWPNDKK